MDPYVELLEKCLRECSADFLMNLKDDDRRLMWDIVRSSQGIRGFLGTVQMEVIGKHRLFEEIDYTSPSAAAKAEGLKGEIRGMRRVLDIFKEAMTDVRPQRSIEPADPGFAGGDNQPFDPRPNWYDSQGWKPGDS